MSEGGSLINLGELSKPATVLIEKIAQATGGVFRPSQIRRVARAEADAEIIRATAKIEIEDLEHRALSRFIHEEAKKQSNIESITQKALPAIDEKSQPEKVEDDWITNFFDKCRLISDGQMQNLWSKVLAGEANAPGRFSKRTVNLIASLDKADAELFQKLSSFAWNVGNISPLIYEVNGEIYKRLGINFEALKHLNEIGLVSFEPLAGYVQENISNAILTGYYGNLVMVNFKNPTGNQLQLGVVLFTKSGIDLFSICDSKALDGFKDYVLDKWRSFGYEFLEAGKKGA